ncbi:MAG: hypothetical protein M1587_09265, partial [Thaumarchaeota archaeon]|nr:hypothetical protein [Nitrososphaerota archaeon]
YPDLLNNGGTGNTSTSGHSGSGGSGGSGGETGGCGDEGDEGCSGSGGEGGNGTGGGCNGGTNCGGGGGHGGIYEGWDHPGSCWLQIGQGSLSSTSLTTSYTMKYTGNGMYTMKVSGMLESQHRGMSGQTLDVRIDGRLIGHTMPTSMDGSFTISIPDVPIGTHTLTVSFEGNALFTSSVSAVSLGGPVDNNHNQPVGKGLSYPYGLVGNYSGSNIVAVTGAGTCNIQTGTIGVCEVIPFNWTATLLTPKTAATYYHVSSTGHLWATYSTNIAVSQMPNNIKGLWLVQKDGSLCPLNGIISEPSMPYLNFPAGIYGNYGWYPPTSF